MGDITKHGDFKRYYCTLTNSNYWVLGYFGGGGINVVDAYNVAKQFAGAISVPLESVKIDEVFSSRRFKGFKFLYSTTPNQQPESNSAHMEDVYWWLRD